LQGTRNPLEWPPLGTPVKKEQTEQKQQARQDAAERNAIEVKFGEGKHRYEPGPIRVRLQQTSETVIAPQLLVMNLEKRLRVLFFTFSIWLFSDATLRVSTR
jgi:hypothetical protein